MESIHPIIMRNPKRREVGRVINGVYYLHKKNYKKHFHRNLRSYAISVSIAKKLLKIQEELFPRMIIHLPVENPDALRHLIVYEISLNDWINYSEKNKYEGCDWQYFCPVEKMVRVR